VIGLDAHPVLCLKDWHGGKPFEEVRKDAGMAGIEMETRMKAIPLSELILEKNSSKASSLRLRRQPHNGKPPVLMFFEGALFGFLFRRFRFRQFRFYSPPGDRLQ